MDNNSIIIFHTADIQVKTDKSYLLEATEKMLGEIERKLVDSKANIYIISGDLFEYGNTGNITEVDRRVISEHLINVINSSVEEIVIIDGNHDYMVKNPEENYLNTIDTVLSNLNIKKVQYLTDTGFYHSLVSDDLVYFLQSIHDNEFQVMEDVDIPFIFKGKKTIISLFHGMVREYVTESKLPIPENIVRRLPSVDDFIGESTILAGDIHERWMYKNFMYPGSPMQHTHNEGTFYILTDKLTRTNNVKEHTRGRGLSMFEIDRTTKHPVNLYTFCKFVPLETYISYVTVTLDPNYPFNPLLLKMVDIPHGKVRTRIKVKTSNIFLKYESSIRSIFEHPTTDISFEYTKVYIDQNTSPVVRDIILENTSGNNDDLLSEFQSEEDVFTSMDKLLLSNDQLLKLFKSIYEPMITKLNDSFDISPEVYSKLNYIFMTELSSAMDASSKRYDIIFRRIRANDFMLLHGVDVDLTVTDMDNVPINGIVRIIGTNGVGKTTIYNMLHWVLTGKVYKEMTSRNVNQNNMVIFNNRRPEHTSTNVVLTLTVNDIDVVVTRVVEKFDNDSLLKELTIEYEYKGRQLVFKDEKAQDTLDKWFGDVPDTIMILNQMKIDNLLKWTSPQGLNDTILNMIGVNYLDKMVDNLDVVRDALATTKPAYNRQQITSLKQDANNKILEHQGIKEHLEGTLGNHKVIIEENEEETRMVNDQLILLGDLPSIKDKLTGKIDELKKQIKPERATRQLVPFTLTMPEPPDTTTITNDIETNEKEVSETNEVIQRFKSKFKEAYDILVDKRKEYKEYTALKISECESTLKSHEQVVTSLYDEYAKELSDTVADLRKESTKLNDIKNDLLGKINTRTKRISTLNDEITSGICATCKRPFAVDYEAYSTERKVEIDTLTSEIKSLTEDVKSNNTKLATIYNDIVSKESHYKEVMKRSIRIPQQQIIDDLREEDIEINKKLKTFTNVHDRMSLEFEFGGDYSGTAYGNIEEASNYNSYAERIKIASNAQASLKEKVAALEKKLHNIQSAYQQEVSTYQKSKQENIDLNESINADNASIQADKSHNESIFGQIKSIDDEIKLLDWNTYNELIDKRETLSSEKATLSRLLYEYNNEYAAEEATIANYKHRIESMDKELEALILHETNQIIWKVYQSTIKNNFKKVVFDYYRLYLNNTLSYLLSDVNFKLFWNDNSELTQITVRDGVQTRQSVKQASGMETIFLGLSLIYTLHLLNVKNSISTIFIDEISGTLNNGRNLSYDATDFQELFIKIINKFNHKTVFIIDHHLPNMFETIIYEVKPLDDSGCSIISKRI
jgi:DNA repair exonuclease SbcCD ATPase subunit